MVRDFRILEEIALGWPRKGEVCFGCGGIASCEVAGKPGKRFSEALVLLCSENTEKSLARVARQKAQLAVACYVLVESVKPNSILVC